MARHSDVVERHHGEAVPDPYRWLENAAGPETTAWVCAQNERTQAWLAAVPARAQIRSQLGRRWDYARFGVPLQRGGRWFQTRNPGLRPQPVLFVMDTPQDEGRVLIDPNVLSDEGTVALGAISVSPDGSKVAYATAASGSDWLTWHVRDVASGTDEADVLEWSKSGDAEWAKDGSGFYYTAMEPPRPDGEYQDVSAGKRIFFHRTGTAQREDEPVFTPVDTAVFPGVAVTPDGRHLVVSLSRGIGPGAELRVLDLGHRQAGWRVLVPDTGDLAQVVTSEGTTFYLLTDDGADRRRIVAVDLERPGREQWREVIAESDDTLLEAHCFGGRLVCHYLRDACSLLRVAELDGAFVRDIPVPAMSTLGGNQLDHELIDGRPDSDVIYFEMVSFTSPAALYRHDLRSGETTVVHAPPGGLDQREFITDRVTVTSPDGTTLPMFLTRRRGLARSGDVPVLLCGYGGVGVSTTPSFSPSWAVWLERGGMLAVACLRGGGEYGRAWHDAGRRAAKQTTFDDFCACARWLAGSGWSTAARIAINGGSNGGLLVGACLTQHPELFGAAIADAGVFDMLRFHRFTVGWIWRSEYGDPDDPEEYRWVRQYSPLHNVRPAAYPPTLLTCGDHDDRVVPSHSYKFAAALQAAQRGDAPILLRVETSAGHSSAGRPTAKAVAEAADRLAFLEGALGRTPL